MLDVMSCLIVDVIFFILWAVCAGAPSCWSGHLWWRHFARISDNRPFRGWLDSSSL